LNELCFTGLAEGGDGELVDSGDVGGLFLREGEGAGHLCIAM
jgi:hypothetical protein